MIAASHRSNILRVPRYRVQYSDGDKEDVLMEDVHQHLLPSFQYLVIKHALLIPKPYK